VVKKRGTKRPQTLILSSHLKPKTRKGCQNMEIGKCCRKAKRSGDQVVSAINIAGGGMAKKTSPPGRVRKVNWKSMRGKRAIRRVRGTRDDC